MNLSALNEKQREAVAYKDGPLLILAGAGTGKTKTLTGRVLYLIDSGVKPENILAITFTNKAACEMRDRLKEALAYAEKKPLIGTFHALGVKILRENSKQAGIIQNFAIFDEEDSLALIKEALKENGLDSKQFEPRKIRGIISSQKNNLISQSDFEARAETGFEKLIASVWQKYSALLKKERALDFDDLLFETVRLLKREGDVRKHYEKLFQFINVDEYQDTNLVQDKLVELLGRHQNVCVVGDGDQSIYGWRGATAANILNFEKKYPGAKIVLLEENYRSTKTILEAANQIICKNLLRKEKNLFTQNKIGEPITLFEAFDEHDEADWIVQNIKSIVKKNVSTEEIAILYRTNWQSRVLEEAMIENNIPYQVVGVRFFTRREIKDAISFLRAALNPESLSDIKRIINLPPRGIGKITMLKIFAGKIKELTPALQEKIKEFYDLLKKIKEFAKENRPAEVIRYIIKEGGLENYLKNGTEEDNERLENIKELVSLAQKYETVEEFLTDAALNMNEETLEDKNGVKLMTVHAAKGLEFNTVFIAGLEEDLFPHQRSALENDPEEERRLFYVAITRAKEKLFMTFAKSRLIFGNRKIGFPSEFLVDLPQNLITFEQSKKLKEFFPEF